MIRTDITFDDALIKLIAGIKLDKPASKENRRNLRKYLSLLALITFLYGITAITYGITVSRLLALLLGCFFIYWAIDCTGLQKRLSIKANTKAIAQLNTENVTYTFDAREIHRIDRMVEEIFPWSELDSYGYSDHYLYMEEKEYSTYLVVDMDKLKQEELTQLEQWLQNNGITRR